MSSSSNRGKDVGKPVGITNIGNSCYMNSILQILLPIHDLKIQILQYPANKKYSKIIQALQTLINLVNDGSLIKAEFSLAGLRNCVIPEAGFRQQDNTEFFSRFMENLFNILDGENLFKSISQLYSYKLKQITSGFNDQEKKILKETSITTIPELWHSIQVRIPRGNNLVNLDSIIINSFTSDLEEGWKSDKTNKIYKYASQKRVMLNLPNILFIAVKRIEPKQEITPDFIKSGTPITYIKKKAVLNYDINLQLPKEVFDDQKSNKQNNYQLVAVAVHDDHETTEWSGLNFGHYMSYIKDTKTNKWWFASDEEVSFKGNDVILSEDVQKNTTMLVYMKVGLNQDEYSTGKREQLSIPQYIKEAKFAKESPPTTTKITITTTKKVIINEIIKKEPIAVFKKLVFPSVDEDRIIINTIPLINMIRCYYLSTAFAGTRPPQYSSQYDITSKAQQQQSSNNLLYIHPKTVSYLYEKSKKEKGDLNCEKLLEVIINEPKLLDNNPMLTSITPSSARNFSTLISRMLYTNVYSDTTYHHIDGSLILLLLNSKYPELNMIIVGYPQPDNFSDRDLIAPPHIFYQVSIATSLRPLIGNIEKDNAIFSSYHDFDTFIYNNNFTSFVRFNDHMHPNIQSHPYINDATVTIEKTKDLQKRRNRIFGLRKQPVDSRISSQIYIPVLWLEIYNSFTKYKMFTRGDFGIEDDNQLYKTITTKKYADKFGSDIMNNLNQLQTRETNFSIEAISIFWLILTGRNFNRYIEFHYDPFNVAGGNIRIPINLTQYSTKDEPLSSIDVITQSNKPPKSSSNNQIIFYMSEGINTTTKEPKYNLYCLLPNETILQYNYSGNFSVVEKHFGNIFFIFNDTLKIFSDFRIENIENLYNLDNITTIFSNVILEKNIIPSKLTDIQKQKLYIECLVEVLQSTHPINSNIKRIKKHLENILSIRMFINTLLNTSFRFSIKSEKIRNTVTHLILNETLNYNDTKQSLEDMYYALYNSFVDIFDFFNVSQTTVMPITGSNYSHTVQLLVILNWLYSSSGITNGNIYNIQLYKTNNIKDLQNSNSSVIIFSRDSNTHINDKLLHIKPFTGKTTYYRYNVLAGSKRILFDLSTLTTNSKDVDFFYFTLSNSRKIKVSIKPNIPIFEPISTTTLDISNANSHDSLDFDFELHDDYNEQIYDYNNNKNEQINNITTIDKIQEKKNIEKKKEMLNQFTEQLPKTKEKITQQELILNESTAKTTKKPTTKEIEKEITKLKETETQLENNISKVFPELINATIKKRYIIPERAGMRDDRGKADTYVMFGNIHLNLKDIGNAARKLCLLMINRNNLFPVNQNNTSNTLFHIMSKITNINSNLLKSFISVKKKGIVLNTIENIIKMDNTDEYPSNKITFKEDMVSFQRDEKLFTMYDVLLLLRVLTLPYMYKVSKRLNDQHIYNLRNESADYIINGDSHNHTTYLVEMRRSTIDKYKNITIRTNIHDIKAPSMPCSYAHEQSIRTFPNRFNPSIFSLYGGYDIDLINNMNINLTNIRKRWDNTYSIELLLSDKGLESFESDYMIKTDTGGRNNVRKYVSFNHSILYWLNNVTNDGKTIFNKYKDNNDIQQVKQKIFKRDFVSDKNMKDAFSYFYKQLSKDNFNNLKDQYTNNDSITYPMFRQMLSLAISGCFYVGRNDRKFSIPRKDEFYAPIMQYHRKSVHINDGGSISSEISDFSDEITNITTYGFSDVYQYVDLRLGLGKTGVIPLLSIPVTGNTVKVHDDIDTFLSGIDKNDTQHNPKYQQTMEHCLVTINQISNRVTIGTLLGTIRPFKMKHKQDIKPEFLNEYRSELIPISRYIWIMLTNVMFDNSKKESVWIELDARRYGNKIRYIRYSLNQEYSNTKFTKNTIENTNNNLAYWSLDTSKSISPGEELIVYYDHNLIQKLSNSTTVSGIETKFLNKVNKNNRKRLFSFNIPRLIVHSNMSNDNVSIDKMREIIIGNSVGLENELMKRIKENKQNQQKDLFDTPNKNDEDKVYTMDDPIAQLSPIAQQRVIENFISELNIDEFSSGNTTGQFHKTNDSQDLIIDEFGWGIMLSQDSDQFGDLHSPTF